jgi:DNA-binding transcriptional LysR family regulator
MLDVRKLRMLTELDRLGTIAAVADELHLTAPGISTQLSALERELGIPLTERRGRRLVLTPAGSTLAAHGRDLLDRLTLAELEVDALRRGSAGTYNLAAFPTAARTFVARAWRTLIATRSGPSITLATHEPEPAIAALVTGEVDLAVIHSYSNVPRDLPPSIATEHVATEDIWIALPADDALTGETVRLEDLATRSWITPQPGLTCFEMTERSCGLAGFTPRIAAQSADYAVHLELVAAGVGVSLVPTLAIGDPPPGVRLARPHLPIARHIHAARRAASGSDPGLDQLVGVLRPAAVARAAVT